MHSNRKSSLSLRSDDFRLKIFVIFIQTYIAQASDDVFQNLKRQYSPNAFNQGREHRKAKGATVPMTFGMLLECCYSQETRNLENWRKLYQV
jgi:hypothetical protein